SCKLIPVSIIGCSCKTYVSIKRPSKVSTSVFLSFQSNLKTGTNSSILIFVEVDAIILSFVHCNLV
ncbi:hypothetical protein ACI6ET_002147, partial [Enterococcus faecium]